MALCYRVSHCTQLVGDSGKMVLQARWLQDMARLSALGAKLGTVSMALYLQRNPLCATCGPEPSGSNIKIGFTVLGNDWPVSKCMDLLADGQYRSEVRARLLCYTCQSIDTNGVKT